jgi:hypothetical protein
MRRERYPSVRRAGIASAAIGWPCWRESNGVLSERRPLGAVHGGGTELASLADDLRGVGTVDIGDTIAVAALALARRFAQGATMWCIAPEWPEHARHVAVEFVHPVLVGKRALPAVSIDASDPVVALRSLVRSGDVVLAVSAANSAGAADVMRRAEAWGATTIWIGAGIRPQSPGADHIVWAEDTQGTDGPAVHDGRLVLLYHVLWELTHVCFEHPGLLAEGASDDCDDDVCVTCSDGGRLGEVIATDGRGTTRVRTARGTETIDTTMILHAAPGDLVLIHAGTAIAEVP